MPSIYTPSRLFRLSSLIYSLQEMTMIHEKQSRQLCAVHTVNNLLQIPPGLPHRHDDDDAIHEWICDGSRLRSHPPWNIATQSEFDAIAREMTMREIQLSNNTNNNNHNQHASLAGEDNGSLSLWQHIRSHHGTPFFGNYSIEVLQMAFERRGVRLDYFRVAKDDTGDTNLDSENSINNTLLGYVIYEQGDSDSSYLAYLKKMGSCYIPFLKHLCQGMHWYAITRVRHDDGVDTAAAAGDDKSWYLIDSKDDEIVTLASEERLLQSLIAIQNGGGLVFRAVVS